MASVLKVMGKAGHKSMTWEPGALESDDPRAIATLREAERIVEEHIAKGDPVFATTPTGGSRQLEHFDPRAEEIIVALPLAGG